MPTLWKARCSVRAQLPCAGSHIQIQAVPIDRIEHLCSDMAVTNKSIQYLGAMVPAARDHLRVSEERIVAFETRTVSRLCRRRVLNLQRHSSMAAPPTTLQEACRSASQECWEPEESQTLIRCASCHHLHIPTPQIESLVVVQRNKGGKSQTFTGAEQWMNRVI
jgi:hypothetical protein